MMILLRGDSQKSEGGSITIGRCSCLGVGLLENGNRRCWRSFGVKFQARATAPCLRWGNARYTGQEGGGYGSQAASDNAHWLV